MEKTESRYLERDGRRLDQTSAGPTAVRGNGHSG